MSKELPDEDQFLRVLDFLGNNLEPSILIGGWATKFRVGGEISRDIDLIVGSIEMKPALRQTLSDYSENRHHGGGLKIRGLVDEIHIDAYIPHESQLGKRLKLSVAELVKHTDSETIRGWRLLSLEAHIATKFAALLDRPDSEKGTKDAREILALLQKKPEVRNLVEILLSASRVEGSDVVALLEEIFKLLPDRAMANKASRKELSNLRRELIDEAERQLRRKSRNY